MVAVMTVIGCSRAALDAREVEIVSIDDEVAQVYLPATGARAHVPTSSLPDDAREGDVVVDGERDERRTQALRAEVVRARGKQARVSVQRAVALDHLPAAPPVRTAGSDHSR